MITLGELFAWALRRKAPRARFQAVATLQTALGILPVDETVARRFGELRAELLDLGRPTSTADLLIAATAIVHDLTLVTHNTKHFAAVNGLRVVDWL